MVDEDSRDEINERLDEIERRLKFGVASKPGTDMHRSYLLARDQLRAMLARLDAAEARGGPAAR